MNATPNLDPDALARLCRLGGGKFVGEMIDLFLDYGARKLVEARQAQSAGDLQGVAGGAHPLKSSAGNVGRRHCPGARHPARNRSHPRAGPKPPPPP
jgi:HPt (histidine-containing phosphotransfer) domain-containing protein